MPRFFAHAPRIRMEEVAQAREVAFSGRLVDAAASGGSSTSRLPQVYSETISNPKSIWPWRGYHLRP